MLLRSSSFGFLSCYVRSINALIRAVPPITFSATDACNLLGNARNHLAQDKKSRKSYQYGEGLSEITEQLATAKPERCLNTRPAIPFMINSPSASNFIHLFYRITLTNQTANKPAHLGGLTRKVFRYDSSNRLQA